jgi:hypothetical protein
MLKTSRKIMDITADCRSLQFGSTIPGGFASFTTALSRPLDMQPDEIEYYGKVIVYDTRNGTVVFEGRLEDPGRSAGSDGEIWNVTAVGPSAFTKDRTEPIIYVDTSLDRWERSYLSTANAETDTSEVFDGFPALQVRATEGVTVTTAWQGDFMYHAIQRAGQKVARIRCDHIEESVQANCFVSIYARLDGGATLFNLDQAWSTATTSLGASTSTALWDLTTNIVSLRAHRTTATITATATFGAQMYSIVIRAMLKDVDGSDITTGYSANTVTPTEVVKDLLGRWLPKFDGPGATISASSFTIDQFAYPDGVSADEVLSDLLILDPAYYWAAWESNTSGLHRFEFKPWPTTVRYEATVVDGFDSPGSGADLYNSVTVRWKDSLGFPHVTIRTQTVQELTDAGITKQAFIDLGDEMGSSDQATYVGDNFLAEHQHPPNAGTLTVASAILDNDTGRMVDPWEIVPGYLIRVTGVLPRIDALNPSDRDGVTVFRIISTQFSQDTASVSLELDSYARTLARMIIPKRKPPRAILWHSVRR